MRVAAFLMIGAFFWTPVAKTGVWLSYLWSLEAYENACVNADRPALECHGKCQVMLEMERLGIESPEVAPLLDGPKAPEKPSEGFMGMDFSDFLLPSENRTYPLCMDLGDAPEFVPPVWDVTATFVPAAEPPPEFFWA